MISLAKLSVLYRSNVFNLYKVVCKTDLLKTVLVVKGSKSGYAMELRKVRLTTFIIEKIVPSVWKIQLAG